MVGRKQTLKAALRGAKAAGAYSRNVAIEAGGLTRVLGACGVVAVAAGTGATATRTTQFMQGKTIRWSIAWTFAPISEYKPGVDAQVNKVRNAPLLQVDPC